MPSEANERLTVARVVRPHGIRGEVAATILTDFPERLTKLREVWLWDGRTQDPQTPPWRAEVSQCRFTAARGGHAIIHFAGVDSIEAAEKLRGLDVQVPLSTRTPIPAGSYYISDLTGCEVWERGAKLGVVRGVQQVGTPVLEIDAPEGELLVPLAQEICTKIDTAARRIEVILPEGLRDLNRPAVTPRAKASRETHDKTARKPIA